MNKHLSRYFFYYPATLIKGERVYEALRRSRRFQWLAKGEIAELQFRRAKSIASWAQENSRFYSELYESADIESFRTFADFSKLPSMSKGDLIEKGGEIVTDFTERSEEKTTGGSTGHPVTIAKNVSALAMERAVTWRAYEWAGVSVGDPQGRFWGVPHTRKGKIKAIIADIAANRKRVSAFDLSATSLQNYYRDLQAFKPSYLYGYVSVIEALANFIIDRKLRPISSVQSVITTAEVLYQKSRDVIENAFGVKVYNEYGCGEVGSIAHECEYGRMHVMADNLLVEIDGEEDGEILVTDFFNYKMPLIRYRVGDYGRLSGEDCPCGRQLPVLTNIYGRAYDLIRLKSGRSIHPEALIYVMEDIKTQMDAISQFQAVQTSLVDVDIYVVPKDSWTDPMARTLEQQMKKHLSSELVYHIYAVGSLQREKSGKMRLVKSLI